MNDHRHDRRAGTDREHKRSFLERTQRVAVTTRPFGIDKHGLSFADLVGRVFVCAQRRFAILAVDVDHADGARRGPEERNFFQLTLGDKAVVRQCMNQRGNVKPTDVIGDENQRRVRLEPFPAVYNEPHTRSLEQPERPVTGAPLVDATGRVWNSDKLRNDHRRSEDQGADEQGDDSQSSAHYIVK